MRAKAKSSSTPYPIWVEGEYITDPPIRPLDGAKRPVGDYIDKGGYPGANVYEVSKETLCSSTGKQDRLKKEIFDKDILLYETADTFAYYLLQDGQAIDIAYGEILELGGLQTEDIKVIGNLIDYPDFTEGISHYAESGEIPYIPCLDAQTTAYPYLKMTCEKCGKTLLSCSWMAKHKDCGGYLKTDFATKIYREKQKALA